LHVLALASLAVNRREFVQLLAAAAAAGLPLVRRGAEADDASGRFYDVARFGNVSLLHFTDCHAQLLPVYYREPEVNLGVGATAGKIPHLVGKALLREAGLQAGSRAAHACSHLDFEAAARIFGKAGGFAHLASLVKRLRAERPGALLLDGGDTLQGSATALWTRGEDMLEASLLLGTDAMTAHWEFTYGAQRVQEVVERRLQDRTAFLAQNVRTVDFEDRVFPAFAMREVNGVAVAVIGQAYPYTPIANPRHLIPDWSFGIRERELQKVVDEVRASGAAVVVLLSHNGMDVDLKLASRVRGIDAILGGHTHDAVPVPVLVANAGGKTLVSNAGSNGKFLALLDFEVREGRVRDLRYRLLPVFANLLPEDAEMAALITRVRAPFLQKLSEPLAVSEGLLYRRGNFNGTFDEVILRALLEVKDAQIAFSPGFRWGTTLLPGQTITREDLLAQTAITYPQTTLNLLSGAQIKTILEDVADNLFNPDPYYQQGGDMVRTGALTYTCSPAAQIGARISDLRLNGSALQADKKYRVAGWGSVAPDAQGEPVWEVVEAWLKAKRRVPAGLPYQPRLVAVAGNPGIAKP
jgi:S-sulfosulfanyl-L-cysteine sulfohydrolase